jgi:hypothetical protein
MSRKLEENIFPNIRRQVHAVVNHDGAILAVQGQVAGPVFQRQVILERLEAPDALAFQDQMQTALDEQAIFQLLDLQLVLQGVADLDDLIVRINVQLLDRQAALQTNVLRFQKAQIYGQRHKALV